MTKYYQDRHKFDTQSDTPISVRSYENTNSDRTAVCTHCNRNMVKLQDRNSANISYFCNMCNIQTNVDETDNLRTRSRLQMPEGVNTNPYASTKFSEPTVGRSPPPIRGSFAELQRRGMKIKTYNDTVKDNRQ